MSYVPISIIQITFSDLQESFNRLPQLFKAVGFGVPICIY